MQAPRTAILALEVLTQTRCRDHASFVLQVSAARRVPLRLYDARMRLRTALWERNTPCELERAITRTPIGRRRSSASRATTASTAPRSHARQTRTAPRGESLLPNATAFAAPTILRRVCQDRLRARASTRLCPSREKKALRARAPRKRTNQKTERRAFRVRAAPRRR